MTPIYDILSLGEFCVTFVIPFRKIEDRSKDLISNVCNALTAKMYVDLFYFSKIWLQNFESL